MSGTLVSGGNVDDDISWAPDSSRIAYVADQDSDGTNELYTSEPDGSNNAKVNGTLVSGGDVDDGFSWAPDSSRIAYVADQDSDDTFELYTSEPDGSNNVKVSGSMVSGGNVQNSPIQWALDSSRIVYRADQDSDGTYELYASYPTTSTGNIKLSGTQNVGFDVRTFSIDGYWDIGTIA